MTRTVKKYRVTGHPRFDEELSYSQKEFMNVLPQLHAFMERENVMSISKEATIDGELCTFSVDVFEQTLTSCQECGAVAIVEVTGKISDMCHMRHLHRSYDGYVLRDMGVGEDDYLEFEFCVNCGQIQGDWPKRIHGRIVTKQTEGYPYDR